MFQSRKLNFTIKRVYHASCIFGFVKGAMLLDSPIFPVEVKWTKVLTEQFEAEFRRFGAHDFLLCGKVRNWMKSSHARHLLLTRATQWRGAVKSPEDAQINSWPRMAQNEQLCETGPIDHLDQDALGLWDGESTNCPNWGEGRDEEIRIETIDGPHSLNWYPHVGSQLAAIFFPFLRESVTQIPQKQ